MYTVIQSQDPFSGLITLDEAKRQCRLLSSYTLDDDDLTDLIETTCDLAQTYTRRLLTPGVIALEIDEYKGDILLPYGNVTTVNEVLLDDVEDTEFEFSTVTGILKPSRTYNNIKVNYDAGYTTLPSGPKRGILMMISTMYNNRDDYVTGMTAQQMPFTSLTLLNAIKDYHV